MDVSESFAAFGTRRDPADWSGPPSGADETAIAAISPRGYTFHTNSEASSLIHMNGRIADGLTGRFLSADPFIPNPGLTQSFNRYSYVNNNPLTFTDPTGFTPCIDPGSIKVCASIVRSIFSFAKSLFGKNKRPPPKGCLGLVSTTGCYGKPSAPKLWGMASDVLGLPRHRTAPLWEGAGVFGSGPCGKYCLSFDDVQPIDVPTDIVGSPDLDGFVLLALAQLATLRVEQAFEIVIASDTAVVRFAFTVPERGTEDTSRVQRVENILAVVHTHVRSPSSRQITKARELPGPGDHVPLEQWGVPNYVLAPSTAVRVLERIGGKFRVRTVRGTDAPGQDSWKPGICSARMKCEFK